MLNKFNISTERIEGGTEGERMEKEKLTSLEKEKWKKVLYKKGKEKTRNMEKKSTGMEK